MRIFDLRIRAVRQFALAALPLTAILMGEFQVMRATWAEYLRWRQGSVDVPRQIGQRIAQIDRVLPPYGYIGYVDPDHSWHNADATRTFYLTQYALAPRVIIYGVEPDYVIYFSHKGKPLAADAIPHGMRVLLHVQSDLAVLTRSR